MGYLAQHPGLAIRYTQKPSAAQQLYYAVGLGDAAIQAMGLPRYPSFGIMADSSYAPEGERERMSVSGYVFFVYGNIVCWKSKLQPITAGSTHEAELIGLATAANEGVWLHRLLDEIKVIKTKPVQFLDLLTKDPFSHNLEHATLQNKNDQLRMTMIWKLTPMTYR